MQEHEYKARDKTVQKMSRDGLREENLRNKEEKRITGRDTDTEISRSEKKEELDFSKRRQERLKEERNLTMLFIAHDLSMVKHISDKIGVMYLGNMVEMSSAADLYKNPYHPYTEALLSAVPIADPDVAKTKKRIFLQGDVPSPVNPPKGCRFCGRCSKCMDICHETCPELKEISKDHWVACHLYDE